MSYLCLLITKRCSIRVVGRHSRGEMMKGKDKLKLSKASGKTNGAGRVKLGKGGGNGRRGE